MTPTPTPGQARTAAATAARKRRKHERLAEELRAAGYVVVPPGTHLAEQIRSALSTLDPSTAALLTELAGMTTAELTGPDGEPETH